MITHNRTTALHSVDIRLLPSQWDGAAGCVTEHPQRMFLNAHLFRMRSDWEIAMLRLADSGEMRRACSAAALRDMLLQTLYPEKYGSRNLFLDRYKAFTESRATPGTRRTYAGTIPRIEAYDPMIGTRTFEDIDRRWLAGFEEFLSRTAGRPMPGRSISGTSARYSTTPSTTTSLRPTRSANSRSGSHPQAREH